MDTNKGIFLCSQVNIRPYIPSPIKHFYIDYSVESGSKQTFTTKCKSEEEAVAALKAYFASGDMLNAPAWHLVQILSVNKDFNPRLEAKIAQQSKIKRHFR